MANSTFDDLLKDIDIRSDEAVSAKELFQYAQFLLDKDENLTRTGNLNSSAKDLLRKRLASVLNIEMDDPDDQETDAD